jgi:hypothetical protein
MKLALLLAQSLCLLSLWWNVRHKYFWTLAYLILAICATLAYRSDVGWLKHWYALIVFPVALARLFSAIEVIHRQSEGFRYWARLIGGVFLLAWMFAGLFAILTWHEGNPLFCLVQLRRLIQVYTGSLFLVLEVFWLSQGGGWYRRSDWMAVWFGLLCFNHATVSVLCGAGVLPNWWDVQFWSWALDGLCYLGLAFTAKFRVPLRAYRDRTQS